MIRTIFATLSTALLLSAALPGAVHASDLEDCRSRTKIPKEMRLKACDAVITGNQATGADLAFAYFKRAMINSGKQGSDQALIAADVNKAIELNPDFVEAYAYRAIGYNRAQQYDKALADLTSAIKIAPDRWGLFWLRAMVYVEKKDKQSGIADFKAALALNPPQNSADMIRQRIAKLEQSTQ